MAFLRPGARVHPRAGYGGALEATPLLLQGLAYGGRDGNVWRQVPVLPLQPPLDLSHALYVLYGVKYIDLVSLALLPGKNLCYLSNHRASRPFNGTASALMSNLFLVSALPTKQMEIKLIIICATSPPIAPAALSTARHVPLNCN